MAMCARMLALFVCVVAVNAKGFLSPDKFYSNLLAPEKNDELASLMASKKKLDDALLSLVGGVSGKDDGQEAAEEEGGGNIGGSNPMDCMKTCGKIEKTAPKSEKCSAWQKYKSTGGCAETCAPDLKAMISRSLCDKMSPLKGPAHRDNLQDELVDQADPQFSMLDADGDKCVTMAEQDAVMEKQFQQGAPDLKTQTEQQKKKMQQVMDMMRGQAKKMFNFVDKNNDACIDRAEFKAAQEMEGPPPGYQETMQDEMGEEKFKKQLKEERRAEFGFMDRSGDGQISKTEVYNYADKNMPQADISKEKLDALFDDTDVNKDGFVTYDEFLKSGQNHDGDGNEMEKAVPMTADDVDDMNKPVPMTAKDDDAADVTVDDKLQEVKDKHAKLLERQDGAEEAGEDEDDDNEDVHAEFDGEDDAEDESPRLLEEDGAAEDDVEAEDGAEEDAGWLATANTDEPALLQDGEEGEEGEEEHADTSSLVWTFLYPEPLEN